MEGISELCLVTQASSPDCDVFNVKKTQGLKAKPVHRRRVVSHISTCRNVRVFLVKTSASESGGRNWNPPLPKTPGAGICCDMPASHVQSRLHSLTLITASRSAEVNKNPFPGWSLLTAWLGYVQEDCFFFLFFSYGRVFNHFKWWVWKTCRNPRHTFSQTRFPHLIAFSFFLGEDLWPPESAGQVITTSS